jgi:Mrp family chromosome partitioning ATPase
VIIDTPPLLAVADALPLLGSVDATIVVARIGATNRSAARRVREIIDRIPGASLLGVVANDVAESEFAGGYYGYGAYNAVRGRDAVEAS